MGGTVGSVEDVQAVDWRGAMHPDDRAWLAEVEAPLRVLGWEQPLPTFMETYGNPDLMGEKIR